jgi:hypothetical protein
MTSKKDKDNSFSSTLQMMVRIEEKLREIGVKTLTVSSVSKGEAVFTVYFDPPRTQEYTAQ